MNNNSLSRIEFFENLRDSKDPLLPFKYFKQGLNELLNEKLDKNEAIEIFLRNIENGDCKLFIVDEKMNYIFSCTNTPKIHDLKMPFSQIVCSDKLLINESILCFGFGLMQINRKDLTEMYADMRKEGKNIEDHFLYKSKGDVCNIITHFINKEGQDGSTSITFDLFDGKILNGGEAVSMVSHRKTIVSYIINMLLFLNEPRVVTYNLSSNNKRREKKGLIPIPTQLVTRITPELQEYININYESHSKLGFMFDVRGHWRVLSHERYGDNVGRKIWIAPFVRGEGLKVKQVFSIEHK